jgi:hypothetical protein
LSVGARGGPSSPLMTAEVARCITLLDDGLPEPHRAVLVCPYEPGHSVWNQLRETTAEVLFTILAGEISFDDGLSWDASHIKLRTTPTKFDFAFILFQNAAARHTHPMPQNAHAQVIDWAMTYCKHGARGILLGPIFSTNLLTTVPTPEQLRESTLQEVQASLALRYTPFDTSGSELTSNFANLQSQHSLFVTLHATPIRAWQLSYLPTALIEALPFLQVRRPASTAPRLRNILLEGLENIWSATPYQARLPPRDLTHSATPNNISRTARLSNAKRRVDSVLTPVKRSRIIMPAPGTGAATPRLPPPISTALPPGPSLAAPTLTSTPSTKRRTSSDPVASPPPQAKRPRPLVLTPTPTLPIPAAASSSLSINPLALTTPANTSRSSTKRPADSDPTPLFQVKRFRPP